MRSISYSELSSALTCEARWDFAYGGHLTGGDTLKPRQMIPNLTNGRAWGAAVAAWHAFSRPENLFSASDAIEARLAAYGALSASYDASEVEQAALGFVVEPETRIDLEDRIGEILEHYLSTAEPFTNLTRLEDEFDLALPARNGTGRASSRYRFNGYLDGFNVDEHGHDWLVEFKLRESLTPVELITNSRQIRYYAWARQMETDREVVGCYVEERLAEAPKPARLVKAKRKGEGIDGMVPSHAVNQITTEESYRALCAEYGEDPLPGTLEAIKQRQWSQRVPVIFRAGELEEAGKELASGAQLIRDLDSGKRYPIRNTQAYLCRGCRFKKICENPNDKLYVDSIFERRVPKRLKTPEDSAPTPQSEPVSGNPFQAAAEAIREEERRELEVLIHG